jgi:ferrochelatase
MQPSSSDPVAPLPYLSVEELPYDAILVVGFGGPEGRDDVIPFLENVLRGRNVPHERMMAVAEHYYRFGGVSPINGQVRELIAALGPALRAAGVDLPIYWGNRNWHPYLADTLAEMTRAGSKRALAVVLSAYSSYSGCRQYREDLLRAREAVGEGAPRVDKMRVWYNHPLWVEANARQVADALEKFPEADRGSVHLAFTAHSIPESMARQCDYVKQLRESCRLVAESAGVPEHRWKLVYQSRSGRPEDPWLEPDVVDHIKSLHAEGARNVVVHPIGFLSDHIEVLYDLDEEAAWAAKEAGMGFVRSATVGTAEPFVGMMADLIKERLTERTERPATGEFGANHDVCPLNCCLPPARPRPAAAT